MKIGLILECTKNGPDQMVCEYFVERLQPGMKIDSVTFDNKPKLIAGCGNAAAQLLNEKCNRVVIVWDLYSSWRPKGEKPCRQEDRRAIFDSLKQAGVDSPNVHLVCIRAELEAWLLADERAIATAIHKLIHPRRRPKILKVSDPEFETNPKKKLIKIFSHHGQQYSAHVHAIQIVNELPDFNKIKRCPSFVRFALKAAGKVL